MAIDEVRRVVVVTGGGSGIGRGIAEAFVARGAQVVIIGRTEEKLRAAAEEIGGGCAWEIADVGQREQVERAVGAIVGFFGQIDVLVNNAGYSRGMMPGMGLGEVEAVWDEEIDANLKSVFLMSMACAPHMPKPGGRIINISSDAALTGGAGLRTMAYSAAKAGMHGLTFALARELGPQGITVNVIAPGFIAETAATSRVPEETVRMIGGQLPVGRVGRIEDVAAAVIYIASVEAGFITGDVLNVNGGRVFG